MGDEGTRTDGIFFFNPKPAHVDTSVVHPAAPSYLKFGNRPLAANLKREKEKFQQFSYAARLQGADFFPVILDSFGAFGSEASRFITKLADEAKSGGIDTLEDQPIKTYISRSLSFAPAILLSGSRLARARVFMR